MYAWIVSLQNADNLGPMVIIDKRILWPIIEIVGVFVSIVAALFLDNFEP